MTKSELSSKTIPLSFGILVFLFVVGFYIFAAWTEPSQPPPGCPEGDPGCDAPLNIGPSDQKKKGNLDIGGGTLAYWLTKLGESFALKNEAGEIKFILGQDGNVGIGTTNPSAKLTVGDNSSHPAAFITQEGVGSIFELKGSPADGLGDGTGQLNDTDFSGGSHSQTQTQGSGADTDLTLEQDTGSFVSNVEWVWENLPGEIVDVEVDTSGTYLYVINWEERTVKKRRVLDGTVVWTRNLSYKPLSMDIDNSFMYVAGISTLERRNLTNGNLEWTVPTGSFRIEEIVVDGSDLFLTGSKDVGSGQYTLKVEKRRAIDGALVLQRDMQADWGFWTLAIGRAIAVDNQYVFAGGNKKPSGGSWGGVLLKFNKNNLSLVFEKSSLSLYAPFSYTESPNSDMAIDSQYIYLVGRGSGTADNAVARYQKSNGNPVYEIGTGSFNGRAISIDSSYMYVGGVIESDRWRLERRLLSNGTLDWFQETDSLNPGASFGGEVNFETITLQGDYLYSGGKRTFASSADPYIRLEKRSLTATFGYYPSGNFTSRVFDTGQLSDFLNLYWNVTLAAGTSLSFQISTSQDGTSWTPFYGPDGTSGSYYTNSGQSISSAHNNHRYLRYKVYLLASSDKSETPWLHDITISYKQAGVPLGPTITHLTVTYDGKVGIRTTNPQAPLDVNGPIAQRSSTIHNDIAEDYKVMDEASYGDIVRISNKEALAVERSQRALDEKIIGVLSQYPGYHISSGKENWKPVALAGRVPVKISLENGSIQPGDPITASSLPGVGMKATEPGTKIIGFALEAYNQEIKEKKLKQGQSLVHKIFIFINVSYYKQ